MVMVIGVDEFGGPEKLKAFDIPAQPVRSGHVRVDVAAAAVSPTDTIHRSGGRAELLAARSTSLCAWHGYRWCD